MVLKREFSALQSIKEEAYTAFGLRAPWADNPGWHCTESGQILLDRWGTHGSMTCCQYLQCVEIQKDKDDEMRWKV